MPAKSRPLSTVHDGRFPTERMAELGRRGAAKVDRGPGGQFRRRSPIEPPAEPPAPAPEQLPDPPAPEVQEASGLLARFLGRGRR